MGGAGLGPGMEEKGKTPELVHRPPSAGERCKEDWRKSRFPIRTPKASRGPQSYCFLREFQKPPPVGTAWVLRCARSELSRKTQQRLILSGAGLFCMVGLSCRTVREMGLPRTPAEVHTGVRAQSASSSSPDSQREVRCPDGEWGGLLVLTLILTGLVAPRTRTGTSVA